MIIECLLNEESKYGEPQYSEISQEIAKMKEKLGQQLNTDGQALLEEISDRYIYQGSFLIRDAFLEGFCVAMEIIFDVIEHRRNQP